MVNYNYDNILISFKKYWGELNGFIAEMFKLDLTVVLYSFRTSHIPNPNMEDTDYTSCIYCYWVCFSKAALCE